MRIATAFDRFTEVVPPRAFAVLFALTRIALGVYLFSSGWAKLHDWTATEYLLDASGPLAVFFQSLAGKGWVDALNAWGQIALGAGLTLGLLTRPAAFFGVILMLLYYLAHFTQNTLNGFVDMHIVFACLLALFAVGGAGHIFGLNGVALSLLRRPGRLVRFLLG